MLWLGAYFLSISADSATSILFPTGVSVVSDTESWYVAADNFWVAVLIPALAAGVCEELLFRGLILSSFKTVHSDLLKVLIVGALFGVFHLSPYRFLTTAILGGAAAFIVLRTGNIIIPICLHALTDFVGFFGPYFISDEAAIAAAQAVSVNWVDVLIPLAIGAGLSAVGCILMRKDKFRPTQE